MYKDWNLHVTAVANFWFSIFRQRYRETFKVISAFDQLICKAKIWT